MATEENLKPVGGGWNRSRTGVSVQKQKAKISPIYKKYVLGAVCLGGIAAAIWFSISNSTVEIEEIESPRPRKIVTKTNVKPVKAKTEIEKPKEEVVMKRDRHGNLRPWKRPETYRDEKGVLRYKAGGARAPEKDEFKNAIRINTPSNIPRFKYQVENEIATLITLEPGGALFGSIRYDKRFENDFVNSLMEPVEIKEDDTEADKQLKREVEATKKELAQRIKAGENLADIFTETREEIRRLAAIKQDLKKLAREETSDPEMSDEDVKDYYDAVNKLLEEKGIAPVNANVLMKRRAMRQVKAATANE